MLSYVEALRRLGNWNLMNENTETYPTLAISVLHSLRGQFNGVQNFISF